MGPIKHLFGLLCISDEIIAFIFTQSITHIGKSCETPLFRRYGVNKINNKAETRPVHQWNGINYEES